MDKRRQIQPQARRKGQLHHYRSAGVLLEHATNVGGRKLSVTGNNLVPIVLFIVMVCFAIQVVRSLTLANPLLKIVHTTNPRTEGEILPHNILKHWKLDFKEPKLFSEPYYQMSI